MKNWYGYSVKAFTLTELMVVMLLSAITITIGLASYGNVNRQFENYKRITSAAIERSIFDHFVNLDFKRSRQIKYQDNALCFMVEGDPICYSILEITIVRSRGLSLDTFNIVCTDVKLFAENKEIDSQSYETLVNVLWLRLEGATGPDDLFFYKEYTAEEKINLKN